MSFFDIEEAHAVMLDQPAGKDEGSVDLWSSEPGSSPSGAGKGKCKKDIHIPQEY